MTIGIRVVSMRVALKIAYLGDAFFGHQRQPDVRTVEGECLRALKAANVLRDLSTAFFRSASRTDRGVSAVGNVIAFDTDLPPEAVVRAFNGRARGVWAWAVASVPPGFHPRHAIERWYRYHLLEPSPLRALRRAAAVFEGDHDMSSFTSDPPSGSLRINRVDVAREKGITVIDVRAPAFRRGMVRRIVAAMMAHARGDAPLATIRTTLRGERRDFGLASPEPLVLMDVRYAVPFRIVPESKAFDDWRRIGTDARLRLLLLGEIQTSGSGARESDRDSAKKSR
jgi:tRNA pseudouridine38-40 synthase